MYTRNLERGRQKLLLRGEDYNCWDSIEVFPRPHRLFWKWIKVEGATPRPYRIALMCEAIACGGTTRLGKKIVELYRQSLRKEAEKRWAKMHSKSDASVVKR